MVFASPRLVAFCVAVLFEAAVAAGQTADIQVRVRAVLPSEAYCARAIPSQVVVPQSRSFVADRSRRGIEISQVTVGVVILEQTATTTMDIDLRNPSPVRAEAELMIPLPDESAVRSFTFSDTARKPPAELLPKDAAMATYHSIVSAMKDPAILEFAGYNLVRSSVFPIEPYGTQKIRLTYEHLLTSDGHRVDYVIIDYSDDVASFAPKAVLKDRASMGDARRAARSVRGQSARRARQVSGRGPPRIPPSRPLSRQAADLPVLLHARSCHDEKRLRASALGEPEDRDLDRGSPRQGRRRQSRRPGHPSEERLAHEGAGR